MGISGAAHILLAAGRGGDPARHVGLVAQLQAAGLTVLAPGFPMLPLGRADRAMLAGRLAAIDAALAPLPADARVIGVGHSIGATLLLARAGADLWLGPGDRIAGVRDPRLSALVLLAPPLGYVAAPGALDAVDLPLLLRVGSADTVTPPDDARRFVAALNGRPACDFAVVDGADHFSFMDQRPPGQPEPWADAATFRVQLAERIIALAR